MKVLKEGKIVDVWVGQCESCNAVIEADTKDLDITGNTNDQDSTYYKLCSYCEEIVIIFYRINTKEAKSILRKNDLLTIYK